MVKLSLSFLIRRRFLPFYKAWNLRNAKLVHLTMSITFRRSSFLGKVAITILASSRPRICFCQWRITRNLESGRKGLFDAVIRFCICTHLPIRGLLTNDASRPRGKESRCLGDEYLIASKGVKNCPNFGDDIFGRPLRYFYNVKKEVDDQAWKILTEYICVE